MIYFVAVREVLIRSHVYPFCQLVLRLSVFFTN